MIGSSSFSYFNYFEISCLVHPEFSVIKIFRHSIWQKLSVPGWETPFKGLSGKFSRDESWWEFMLTMFLRDIDCYLEGDAILYTPSNY